MRATLEADCHGRPFCCTSECAIDLGGKKPAEWHGQVSNYRRKMHIREWKMLSCGRSPED